MWRHLCFKMQTDNSETICEGILKQPTPGNNAIAGCFPPAEKSWWARIRIFVAPFQRYVRLIVIATKTHIGKYQNLKRQWRRQKTKLNGKVINENAL
jgi:hypothetical protein